MSSAVRAIRRKMSNLYKREILRDEFLLEAKRWFADRGDEKHRLNYVLTADSMVVDIGGYIGDFASDIHEKFASKVHLFEPVPAFYEKCVARFRDNRSIMSHCYGLGSVAGTFPISDSENESSFVNMNPNSATVFAEIREVNSTFVDLQISEIDLFKINIEGGEYEVLPSLISAGWLPRIANLQIQFHNFVPDAIEKRNAICEQLSKTHRRTWCYEFIWENWERVG
jgi:FkbM family methyltransferase